MLDSDNLLPRKLTKVADITTAAAAAAVAAAVVIGVNTLLVIRYDLFLYC